MRPITIETNILPNAHGSCLFTRGQTQALVVATLGSENDAQMVDVLTEKILSMNALWLIIIFQAFQ